MNGVLLINKQKDYTSHDVVANVKKILGEKVGHTGTLDPNATGVLPLLIGKGTKLSKYLIEHNKEYKATLKLGIKTDTLDIVGNVIQKENVNKEQISNEKVEEVLQTFKGIRTQYPPMYSAIKVNGKKLYEYARQGKTVEVKPRQIQIYDIFLNNINDEKDEIVFTVKCSKGTYIRTLCEDIAKALGTIGCMKDLDRLQVGEFNKENAITINELEANKDDIEFLNKHLITFEMLLEKKSYITLNNKELELFLNGVKLKKNFEDDVYKIKDINGKFIGTGKIHNELLKRDVIL